MNLLPSDLMNPTLSYTDDRQKLGWLLGAVVWIAAPHAQNLDPAVMAYFALLALWLFAALYFKFPLPNKALLFLLTLSGASIVLFHYHRFWGQEAGSSLFIVGLGLKLLEIKTLRDAYLVVFLAFFVALTQYLFSQSIPMAGYTLIAVVLLVSAMIGLNSNPAFPVKARLKLAALMTAQAIPLVVLFFVFFPRIHGPLWILPDDSHTATSGLSDTISPGSFSHLALSHETAFRVDFTGNVPPKNLRYWRGPVFWMTNGETWTLMPATPIVLGKKPQFVGEFYTYRVTLEPHNQRWVFALDLPNAIPAELQETTDFQLLARDNITERKQYQLSSGTAYTTGPLNPYESKRALQLPKTIGNQIRDLVVGWQQGASSPKAIVSKALQYFRDQPFYYTLNPPPLSGNPVESFLFDTRRGFCEHYATAFVVLMRQAGVPARVVTGYQGGQWNSIGHFLEVKQADAHAWAEVWLEESGWTRIDPTAAVAPERIEQGVDVESQVALGEIRFNLGTGKTSFADSTFVQVWRKARMVASSIDHAWDTWVLAYDTENQKRLMQWLALLDWRLLMTWLAFGSAIALAGLAGFILPKRSVSSDPAKQIYLSFIHAMARHGIQRHTGEGPHSFAARIGDALPELKEIVERITRLYVRLRYEPRHHPNDLNRLRESVRRIPKPKMDWKRRFSRQ